MKKITCLLVFPLLFASCNSGEKKEVQIEENSTVISETENAAGAKEFWEKLKSLCGKAFEGELASAPANDDSFAGKQLVMHVLSCDDETILIPFNVGENRSRTWILKYKNGRIELKHDHREEDGSDDELTMYGGTTTNSGMQGMQVFPADEETLGMIPAAFSNIWWITVNDTSYTYNLRRIGTDRVFTVAFDLTKEIEIPERSWGWEGF